MNHESQIVERKENGCTYKLGFRVAVAHREDSNVNGLVIFSPLHAATKMCDTEDNDAQHAPKKT